jgi:hypothetical protein
VPPDQPTGVRSQRPEERAFLVLFDPDSRHVDQDGLGGVEED